ncbi:hypothetical protein A4X09_0g2617 [Tilletia walkeri]|uniref:Ubiquitin-like protease family profile domain-containing protein n=1 Tax=Tilletia walkeri TaxID=117179 RepID=A0A8X7NAI4_9BASI|nr:hypothetical protein A4X09_0g2617 [Tilletia walkeri]
MTDSDSQDRVAFSFNGTTLYDSDIQTLAEEEWLGDAIIMLLFSLLEEDAHSADIELWSPAVVQLLSTMDSDNLDPSTSASLFPPLRKFNILPISDAYASNSNTISSHWSLLLIHSPSSFSHLTTYHLDSLDPHNSQAAARCTANFASAFDKMPTSIRGVGKKMEAQENAWDCGIYVLSLTQALVHGLMKKKEGGESAGVVEDIVVGEATPKKVAQWRSRFYHWVRRWQAEARRGGGVWNTKEEVVAALGPWCPDEDDHQEQN